MDWIYPLDDRWWFWMWDTFGITMLMIPGAAGALLKIWAKINPDVPTDSIMELIRVIFTRPGKDEKNG